MTQINYTAAVETAIKDRLTHLVMLITSYSCNRNFDPESKYFVRLILDYNELAEILNMSKVDIASFVKMKELARPKESGLAQVRVFSNKQ